MDDRTGEHLLSGGPMSADYGIGLVGQLKVALRDTEPAALETDTSTVRREPCEQKPMYGLSSKPFGQRIVTGVAEE